jgi:hypothetical protein
VSTEFQQPEDGESFYQTRSVQVVWIPPRPAQPSRRRAILAAKAVAGAAIVGGGLWGLGLANGPVSDTKTVADVTSDTSHAVTTAPTALATAAPVASTVQPVSYAQVPRDGDRRESLRIEIARCKDPAAACEVDEVLRMGSELMELRRRAGKERQPR